jgi:uncharacterized damage-inducible protein DinB
MSQIQALLKEMQQEAATTRKMLERVPEDKFDWKPHPKSGTLKWLSTHIAELPGWVEMTLTTSELDFEANPYKQEPIGSTADLLQYFEKSLEKGKAQLEKATEKDLEETWTLRNGSQILVACSKAEMIRVAYCQTVHHRAQLGVYLRLLDIPIPGSYGPSADEMNF